MFDKVCFNCGTKLSEFYRTYMLGCPDCYKAFEEEILATLKKTQGKTYHTGKMPKITAVDKRLLEEYNHLLKEKEIAGMESRFKDMAILSTRIEILKEELLRRDLL